MGDAYCEVCGGSRLAVKGPPRREDIDIPFPRLLIGGSSRPAENVDGGPTDAEAPRIGGGP